MVDILVVDSLTDDSEASFSEFECSQLPPRELVLFEVEDILVVVLSNVSIESDCCVRDVDFC